MPRCEGRPFAPCPDAKNDSSVHLSQGDLMLCNECENFRFPSVAQSTSVSNVTAAPAVSAAVTSGSTTGCDVSFVVNELLFFVNSTLDNYPASLIKSTVLDFFRDDEILTAKSKFVSSAERIQGLSIQSYCKNRIGTNKVKASLDDIVNIFVAADDAGKRTSLPVFCAADRKRIPVIESELSDIGALRHEVAELKKLVESISQGFDLAGLHHELNVLQQQVHGLCYMTSNAFDQVPESPFDAKHTFSEKKTNLVFERSNNNNMSNLPDEEDKNDNDTHESEPLPRSSLQQSDTAETVTNYAAIVKSQSDAEWQTIAKRKPKRKVIVGESRQIHPFQGVTKKAVVCVSRLHPSTTTDMITNFLNSQGVTVFTCYQLYKDNLDKQKNFVSMRLCIAQHHLSKVMDNTLWPFGVVVRPWKFKGIKHD